MTLHRVAALLLTLAAPACGPSVEVEDARPEYGDGTIAASASADHAPARCNCSAPQVCDAESGGACRCPDAPEGVEAVCEDGERLALCGDAMAPDCHRAAMANAERVACCAD